MVGEGEKSRQRVGIELGKLRGCQPLQESHRPLFVLAGRIHPHTDVGVIGKEAAVTLFRHWRTHHAEINLAGKRCNLPGACHIESGLAGGKQLVAGRIIATLGPLAKIVVPASQLVEHLHVLRVVEPLLSANQRQTPILTLPVIGADVLETQFGGNPALGATHGKRYIAAIRLHLVEHSKELITSLRYGQPQLAENLLVVEEAMDHRGHRYAEGLGTGVSLPGRLGKTREVFHPGHLGQLGQMTRLEQRQRIIKRAAGDEVTGLAPFQILPQGRHVVDVLNRVKTYLDTGM